MKYERSKFKWDYEEDDDEMHICVKCGAHCDGCQADGFVDIAHSECLPKYWGVCKDCFDKMLDPEKVIQFSEKVTNHDDPTDYGVYGYLYTDGEIVELLKKDFSERLIYPFEWQKEEMRKRMRAYLNTLEEDFLDSVDGDALDEAKAAAKAYDVAKEEEYEVQKFKGR